MFRTLYRRLLVVVLGFGMAMTAIFAVILLGYHEAYHTEADQTVNRRIAQQYADARLLITDEPLTVLNFHQGIQKLAELNPDVDIYLLDDSGAIVASSVPAEQWARRRVDPAPLRAFLSGSAQLPILGDDPRFASGTEIFSVAPVDIRDCPARLLYVVLHRERYESAVRQLRRTYAINESLSLLISCGILAIATTLILIRSITRRLSTLKGEMETFYATALSGSSNLGGQGATQGDEIERLAALFSDLSGRVRSQMATLRETDDMRRSMVANISHDLRTPLTTLQAHLDTLSMKDGELTPVERRQYLATAISQCRRLTRLIAQLLELAKLDAGQVEPLPEPFQLTELVQDIVQKFSLTASTREVSLRAECDDALPLVTGDISLIERVIDNLMDNAVQHSPPGGTVVLRATPGNPGHVRLEVEDGGPGIAPEDRDRIFDRFFRGDRSRSGSQANAGLGLAIVKSILDLHGIAITVRSEPGAGACFSFELPLYEPQVPP
ncbi:MAG: HAMP domain-containing histidine kinase [Chromatiales bacterium]|nr:HAMP domain-containing histidine kinase [Chromatiales bacterium]